MHGADPNIADNKGNTSISIACSTYAVDCIDVLMQFKADLSIHNYKKNYPIHMCLYRGNIECYEKLVKYSKHINSSKLLRP